MAKKQKKHQPTPFTPSVYSLEHEDLKLLGLSILTVLLTWIFVMGWRPGFSIMGQDAWQIAYPTVHDFLKTASSSWQKYVYRSELLGGSVGHDIVGTQVLLEWGGLIGFSAVSILNLIVISFQSMIAFLGLRIAMDLTCLWKEEKTESTPLLFKIISILILSFSPVLAWRISRGHYIIISGLFVFLTLLASIISIRTKRVSLTLAAVCFFALLNAFPSPGQQTILYSVIFGAPILLALLWPILKKSELSLFLNQKVYGIILVLFGSLLVSMPKLAPLLHYAMGSDSSRSIGGAPVTYSYVTATLQDWFTSLPWSYELFPIGRDTPLHHEVNYPFGAILLLLFLVPWKRSRFLGLALFASAFLAIAFSMDLKPISSILLAIIPPLSNFRVPERAILPLSVFLPSLCLAGLWFQTKSAEASDHIKKNLKSSAFEIVIAFAFLLTVMILPPALRETLTLLTGLALLVLFKVRKEWLNSMSLLIALIIFSGASLGAFKERLVNFESEANFLAQGENAKAKILSAEPALAQPLERAHLLFQIPPISVNTGYAIGISTLDAYYFAPKRFLQLIDALEGRPFNPTNVFFNFGDGVGAFPILRQLYNVRYNVDYQAPNYRVSLFSNSAGQAWFSQSLERTPNFDTLAASLHQNANTLSSLTHTKTWLVEADPLVQAAELPIQVNPECGNSRLVHLSALRGEQKFTIQVETHADCPFTLATNYLSSFQVDKGFKTFPSTGSLLGVWVPAGTTEFTLEAKPYTPTWALILWFIGIAISAFGAFRIYFDRMKPGSPTAALE